MKAVLMAIALMTGVIQHTVYAHSTHAVDEPTAISIVQSAIPQLITKDFGFEVGQLDASWKSITEKDVTMVETDGDFYIMSATNPESKAAIFFLIGINGQVMEVTNNNNF
jgi:methionine-rich copper-binding protein CopC